MDATLLTILLILVSATVLALVQARRRDKCLQDFAEYYVTLAEKDGDLTWGHLDLYTTGMEVRYLEPVEARRGHLERSYIFYKDQYDAMDALYRYPEGLPEEQQRQRRKVIERTANPGVGQRMGRRVRNWFSMVRDALVQAVAVVIGTAKAQKPGSAVLGTQEQNLKALSGEIIGYAGNAYDPLLEQHLFKQVVVEVTRDGKTRSYCGWLKDYTTQFVEVVDAFANAAGVHHPVAAYRPGEEALAGVSVRIEKDHLYLTNGSEAVLYVRGVEAGSWSRRLGCVLPPGYISDLALPSGVPQETALAWIGTVERVDMVVPRTHALIRHAADGSEALRPETERSVTARAREHAVQGDGAA